MASMSGYALDETPCYGPRIPGAAFADLMKALVGPDSCVPVRDRDVCAHCKQRESRIQGDKLQKCERCRAASYCGAECQRQHWRVHKQLCSTKEQRIDQVLTGDAEKPMRRCSRELASAALDATGQHVTASRLLCSGLTTGFFANFRITDEQEIFSTMNLMFRVKLSPSDFENVLNADPAIAALYSEGRELAAAEEAAMAASMEQVIRLCAGIHESLVTILPGICLKRYRGPDSPHSSNRELVDNIHAKIAASYKNVPEFLRLADECLACTNIYGSRFPVPGCPYSPEQIRHKVSVLKNLVFSTWLQYARKFEGDDESSDVKLVQIARQRWYIYSMREVGFGGNPGMPFDEWVKQPGNWAPLNDIVK